MEYKVLRCKYGKTFTRGIMVANGLFKGYTLEDRTRTQDEAFIYGETAIPAGRYEVIVNMSPKFKKRLPILLNVPGFEGVRIHGGNTDKDTLGCVLVGTSLLGAERIFGNFVDALIIDIDFDVAKGIKSYIEIVNTFPGHGGN